MSFLMLSISEKKDQNIKEWSIKLQITYIFFSMD